MVPFGLEQAPAYFKALISEVLKGLSHFAIAYLDDIIIFSKTKEEHLQHLEIIFQRLHEGGAEVEIVQMQFYEVTHEVLRPPHFRERYRTNAR